MLNKETNGIEHNTSKLINDIKVGQEKLVISYDNLFSQLEKIGIRR